MVRQRQEINLANHQLASIIESSTDAIVSVNMDGIITSWNPAAERVYGNSAEEMIGQPFSFYIPPEKMEETVACFEKIMGNSKVEPYETLRIRKDGSTIAISLTVSPIYDGNGAVIGASSFARNITEQQQASKYALDLLESTLDGIVIINKTGTIVTVNSQAEKLFGYHRDEMLGQLVEFLIPSRFHAKHPSQRDHFFADSHPRSMGEGELELFGRGKDGLEFPIEVSLGPIKTAEGLLIVAAIRDVTDKKHMTSNLIEINLANRQLASIIESSNDAIASANINGIITSWNHAAERMFGYLAEEMIGQPPSRTIPPEEMQETADNLSNIRDGYMIEPYETLRIKKDGSTFPISLTMSPIYDGNGAIIGSSRIARDITQEKQASQHARNMTSIIESSNDAILSSDTDGILTSWNPAAERMFGYSAEEMIGQTVLLIIPPENTHELANNLSKIRNGYTIEPYETLRIRKDGSTIPISLTVSPIFDGNGAVIGASAISRDITGEKKMIRHLEEMNELRNEFVATVAHDLRAPMASIGGFAHLLIDEWNTTDDEKKIEYLRIITRNTDTLAEFVEDMLQVARIEAGEYTYDIHSFDARALVQKAIDEAIGPNSDQRLELITPDDLPLVLGDEERQWQVLTNLFSNALKFSPAQEPIVVELSRIGDFVRVAVIDRGIGIAKDDLTKLFRKSGRLVKSGDPIIPGNGLGLFICKTLVEAQGGQIWCESALGAGSTFFFTIPVAR